MALLTFESVVHKFNNDIALNNLSFQLPEKKNYRIDWCKWSRENNCNSTYY